MGLTAFQLRCVRLDGDRIASGRSEWLRGYNKYATHFTTLLSRYAKGETSDHAVRGGHWLD